MELRWRDRQERAVVRSQPGDQLLPHFDLLKGYSDDNLQRHKERETAAI